MSGIVDFAAGWYVGEKIAESCCTKEGACCCLGLVLLNYLSSCQSFSHDSKTREMQKGEKNMKPLPVTKQPSETKQSLENIIDPDKSQDRIRECVPENSPPSENVIDPYTDKASSLLLKQIRNYQENISPRIKERIGRVRLCKFEPSCSEYARQAIIKYGSAKGTAKAAGRLARCNPWSKGGYDPVT